MRISLFVLVLIHLCSCSARKELVATWSVKNYSFFEQSIAYIKGSRGMIMDSELLINSDSTFKKTSRVGITTGTWSARQNKLYLNNDLTIRNMNHTTA